MTSYFLIMTSMVLANYMLNRVILMLADTKLLAFDVETAIFIRTPEQTTRQMTIQGSWAP